uniref:Uncharacterized protein n=1 Tax=Hyaloperonospora arabidopsidis (strain Emoy2) TaxID=559515 RepID=M4BN41_HYAAE
MGNLDVVWARAERKGLGARSRDGSSDQKVKRFKHLHIGQGDLVEIWVTYIK